MSTCLLGGQGCVGAEHTQGMELGRAHKLYRSLDLLFELHQSVCRGLRYLLEEEWMVESRPQPTGLILRQIFDLLEQQTVEPWSSSEVESAAVSIQRLLKHDSLDWLQVPVCTRPLGILPLAARQIIKLKPATFLLHAASNTAQAKRQFKSKA